MRAAAASALQAIAAESIVQAIYSTALGFLRLAHHDYPGATAAGPRLVARRARLAAPVRARGLL